MAFFGPGGLTGKSEPGLDPQLMQALIAQFPGLQSLQGQPGGQPGGQQPQTLASLGYQWPGPTWYQGQGSNAFTLSPFEGVGSVSPESITAGLASGSFGKSSSQTPFIGAPISQGSLLSLPSLQLPMAQIAATQGGYSGDEGMMGGGGQAPAQDQGFTVTAGDVLDTGQQALSLFGGDSLGTQTTTPGYAEQRTGERADYSATGGRDLSSLGGSFLNQPAPISSFLGLPQDTTFSTMQGGDLLTPPSSQFSLAPGTTLSMPGAGETMFAPGGADASQILGPQQGGSYMGAAQGGIGSLMGLLNLYQGAQGGNIGQGIGGALGTAGGLTQLLQSSPQLSGALGISEGALGGVGGAVGGLGGLFNLAQGIESGNPMQIGSGALGTLQGAQALGLLGGSAGGGIGGVIATQFPQLASALTSIAGTGAAAGAGAGTAATGAAVSAALSGLGAAAAPIIAFVVSYIGAEEEKAARMAGWANNPIAGGLLSNATAGVGQSQDILDRITQSGGAGQIPTALLGSQLSDAINSLLPYYATAQGPKGAIRASDALTGMFGREGLGGADEYTAKFTQARTGVENLLRELQGRGLTYEQLGALPGISGDWTQQNLDAGGTPDAFLRQAIAQRPELGSEAAQLYSQMGLANYDPYRGAFGNDMSWQSDFGPNGLNTPEGQQNFLLQQALGASMAGPADVTNATGLYTNMYGGPLWAAMARMGAGGPEIQGQIQQHFDPWVNIRTPEYQAMRAPKPTEEDRMRFLAAQGYEYQDPTLPEPASPIQAGTDYWNNLQSQYAQQQAAQDPMAQQLQQYIQQLGQLTQQAPQLLQGFQGQLQGAPVPWEMAMAGGGGAPATGSGGGIDLEALLRQLGYLA